MQEPVSSRPYMPGYGIVGPDEGRGLLPWSWAEERLVGSHDYWLATVTPAGRPHVMPVWGVWHERSAWFSASFRSRKTRNLEVTPHASITTDNALQPVVVDGDVERIVARPPLEEFTRLVNSKYETDYPLSFFTENACFRLRPTWVFSLDETDFVGTPTRWTFGSAH